MSEIKEYKCPACGGAMEFDSKSQKMKCPYCDTEISVDEYESLIAKADQVVAADAASDVETEQKKSENYTAHDWNQDEIDNMVVYICQSCGGEITTDKNTGATTCPFCGNRVVLKGQFEGALKPDYVIPFKLDKKAAKEAYYKHLTGKAFIPSVFRQENHIDEIVGLYVPFWVFNIESEADISYDAEKIRVWKSGDTEYTEHKYYKIRRGGTIYFEHVPEDGSVKMDDALMESLEPYDFKDAVPFKSAYLAGYVADRYDVDQDECMKRAKKENQTEYGRFFSGDCQRILCTFYAEQYSKYPGFQDQLCHVSGMASEYYVERTEVHICHERTEWKDCRRFAGGRRCILEICRNKRDSYQCDPLYHHDGCHVFIGGWEYERK